MQYERLCLNLMTQFDKGKGYERTRTIKTFEFENTTSNIKKSKTEKNGEKRETICQTYQTNQVHLPKKVTPVIDLTDKPVIQCDVPVIENTFVHDCKCK